jgi:hypothetical protein
MKVEGFGGGGEKRERRDAEGRRDYAEVAAEREDQLFTFCVLPSLGFL